MVSEDETVGVSFLEVLTLAEWDEACPMAKGYVNEAHCGHINASFHWLQNAAWMISLCMSSVSLNLLKMTSFASNNIEMTLDNENGQLPTVISRENYHLLCLACNMCVICVCNQL